MSEFSLRAGPQTVLYQNGFLRYISHGENEILRMIYFALRDENWGTYPCKIENEKLDIQIDHFSIQYDCFHECKGNRIYRWQAMITGSQQGEITFEIHGVALQDILKNRAGFCILHPIQGVVGQVCEMINEEGETIHDTFPTLISAANPFKNLKGMRWQGYGSWWSLAFEGDTFETEDQRNWTDASYKTFCTPLEKPFPVKVKKGDQIYQRISFLPEPLLKSPEKLNEEIQLTVTDHKLVIPSIGICASSETDDLSKKAIERLRSLKLDHYRIDITPSDPHWLSLFKVDCINALTINLPLTIGLHLTSNHQYEIEQFILQAQQANVVIKHIILFHIESLATPQQLIDYIPTIKSSWPEISVGAGTNYNFTELNRNQFKATLVDFISFSIDPQEHASDNHSMIENLEGQYETVQSSKHLYPDKPIHVSPLTLRRRNNPYAIDVHKRKLSNNGKSDPRQQEAFGAVFTIGSIKALTLSQAESITLFQTVGNQGVLSTLGDPFPVYDVLATILEKPYLMIVTKSSHPLKVEALILERQQVKKLVLVNYTKENQTVHFENHVVKLSPLEVSIQSISN